MKTLRKLSVVGALCCLLAAPAIAQKPRPQFPFEFQAMGLSKLKDFGVTDEQIQQITQIYQGSKNTLIDLQADVAKKENNLRDLLRTPQFDSVQAERSVDALIEARGRLAKATTMMMVRMRQLMTVDQWEKLSEYQEHIASNTMLPSVPPQPLPPGVFRPGVDGVTAPQLLYKVDPSYTEQARNAKIEGSIALYIVVDVDGTARDIRIPRSLDAGLDQKAIEAVRQWRFKPGTKDGRPVPVAATVEVNFRLM